MSLRQVFLLHLVVVCALQGCRITQQVPVGGEIISRSGQSDCPENSECLTTVDTADLYYESFHAVPREGFVFEGFDEGLCETSDGDVCRLEGVPPNLTSLDVDTFLRPVFKGSAPAPTGPMPILYDEAEMLVAEPEFGESWNVRALVLPDGKRVVAWSVRFIDPEVVQFRVFDQTGAPLGDAVTVSPDDGTTDRTVEQLEMVNVSDGVSDGFALVYGFSFGLAEGIPEERYYISRFDDDGQALASPQLFHTATDFPRLRVAEDDGGGFYVALGGGSNPASISLKAYDSSGVEDRDLGVTTVTGNLFDFDLDVLADGSVALFYEGSFDTNVRCLSSSGQLLQGPTAIDTYDPRVLTALTGGGFVIAGPDEVPGQGDDDEILARIYNGACVAAGDWFQVNTQELEEQTDPDLVALQDGGFFVTWSSDFEPGTLDFGVYARRYDASGQPLTDEIHINRTRLNPQRYPRAAGADDVGAVIAWLSQDFDPRVRVFVRSLALDKEGDGIGDAWERFYGFNDSSRFTPYFDSDGDGLTTRDEFRSGTNPLLGDTDADGMSDPYEVENGLRVAEDDSAEDPDNDGATSLDESIAGTQANYRESFPGYNGNLNFGRELLVHEPSASREQRPTVAAEVRGGYAVAWQSADGLYGQVFNGNGRKFGSQFHLPGTDEEDDCPAVLGLADGGFAIAWNRADRGDGTSLATNHELRLERFDAFGVAQQSEQVILAPDPEKLLVNCPRVAQLSGGRIAVVWQEISSDFVFDIRARLLGADGVPVGPAFNVADGNLDPEPSSPAVRALADGSFVVAYYTRGAGGRAIEARVVTAVGEVSVDTWQVSPVDGDDHDFPSLAVLDNGNLVFFWRTRPSAGGDGTVSARILDSTGTPVTAAFVAAASAGNDLGYPQVAAIPAGFFAVWNSQDGEDGNQTGAFGLQFGLDGTPAGTQLVINSRTVGDQFIPLIPGALAALADNAFVVVWTDKREDDNADDIMMRRFGVGE